MRKAQFKKSLPVPLTKEMYNAVKSITDEREIAMAVYVRNAIELKLQQEKTKGDIHDER